MSEFLPGDLVLCVDDTPHGTCHDISLRHLQKGKTYTVWRFLPPDMDDPIPGLILVEVKSCHFSGGYNARRFIRLVRPSEFASNIEANTIINCE